MYHKGILRDPSIPCHSTLPIWSKINSTAATSDHQRGAGFPPIGLCSYTVSTLASSQLAEFFLQFYFLCSEQLLLFIIIQCPVKTIARKYMWFSKPSTSMSYPQMKCGLLDDRKTSCEIKRAGEPIEKLPCPLFFNIRRKNKHTWKNFSFSTKEKSSFFVPKIWTILTHRGYRSSNQPCVSRQKRSC